MSLELWLACVLASAVLLVMSGQAIPSVIGHGLKLLRNAPPLAATNMSGSKSC